VDPDAGTLDDAELIALARGETERLYGITAAPLLARAHRWARAIPQYDLGHLARVARIERGVAARPGLFITGFGLRAIGFSDAAVNAIRCGERAAAWLAGAEAPLPVAAGA
jgi:oxygen-dependent protoporphyrinogen oxidase